MIVFHLYYNLRNLSELLEKDKIISCNYVPIIGKSKLKHSPGNNGQ